MDDFYEVIINPKTPKAQEGRRGTLGTKQVRLNESFVKSSPLKAVLDSLAEEIAKKTGCDAVRFMNIEFTAHTFIGEDED